MADFLQDFSKGLSQGLGLGALDTLYPYPGKAAVDPQLQAIKDAYAKVQAGQGTSIPDTNIDIPHYSGGGGDPIRRTPPTPPLSPRLSGGMESIQRGAYNTDPGSIDPLALTGTQMKTDQALRDSFAERELDPLRQAATRSTLEQQAADPLAKERLLGGFEVAARRAPMEAQREFDLEDQKILEALGPKIEAEFMANPKWVALKRTNPKEADNLLKEQLRRRIQEFKNARGKFTERMDTY